MAISNAPPSRGENITHFTAVRMRVTGSGSLQLRLLSLDDVRTQTLSPLTLATSTNIIPTRLCNFLEQRGRLEVKITAIDEYFKINRIVIFVKETYSSYPG